MINLAVDFIVTYGFQIIGAMIVLIVGWIAAKWVSGATVSLCQKREFDITLTKFLGNVVKVLVLVFAVIIAMGKLGISIAPFIAAIGAIAFGASFALQGPLSNYGAGLVIIITRPFIVGDTVAVKQVTGVVEEVSLAATVLSTEDGEKITIPNKHIVGEIINNSFANKVVESVVGISYQDDPHRAIDVLRRALAENAHVISDPAPQVGIEDFGDSSINIGYRYWVPTKRYFKTLYEVNLAVYGALTSEGISIPFPQRDVHLSSPPPSGQST
jgi:small conductance mechanosensitive channel